MKLMVENKQRNPTLGEIPSGTIFRFVLMTNKEVYRPGVFLKIPAPFYTSVVVGPTYEKVFHKGYYMCLKTFNLFDIVFPEEKVFILGTLKVKIPD